MYHYADAIEALADRFGDDRVLTHDGVHRTWRQFDDRAARLGQSFADAGLKPGSKTGLLLYNCSEYYETFLAALKMRMVPFNVNYRYVGGGALVPARQRRLRGARLSPLDRRSRA